MSRLIGMIGAGQMGTALARGICDAFPEDTAMLISDPSELARRRFRECLPESVSVEIANCNQDLLDRADVVFLAVKPQYLDAALEGVHGVPGNLTISILAGVAMERLSVKLGHERLVRVMPNTPCLIQQGVCGVAMGPGTTDSDQETVEGLLRPLGVVEILDEGHLDAVTGLSGSGPAFVFTFVESLIDAGVESGLPRHIARSLALQTVIGSARLIEAGDAHPAVLRDQVTSPGGTTMAGMASLEADGFRNAVMSAVRAATEKSRQLGN